jgi:hypothetical protein
MSDDILLLPEGKGNVDHRELRYVLEEQVSLADMGSAQNV